MADKYIAPGAGVLVLDNTTDTNDEDMTISHMVCSCTVGYGLYVLEDNHGNVLGRYRTTVFDPTGIVPIKRTVKGGVKTTALPLAGTSTIDVHIVKR